MIVFLIVVSKSKQFKFTLNKSFLISTLKQTYPYALLVLIMTFYYRLDAIMLERMLVDGQKQAAIYAQAYRLLDSSNNFGILFATLLLPMFANMIKNNKKTDELVKLSFSLLFIPAIVLAVFSFFFSNEIMEVLYVSNTANSAKVLQVLMICFVAIGSTYIFGTLLTANGSLKILNQLALGGMVLNFVLNFLLIPQYQAEGSAYASLITQFLIIIAQVFIAKKVFKFKVNYKFIGTIVVYILAVIILIIGIKNYISEFSMQFILFITISGILAIIIRVVSIKKMYQILVDREL